MDPVLKVLGYRYEERGKDDPLRAVAAAVIENPLFTSRINLSLAIRKALRRYLGIEGSDRVSSSATDPARILA